MGRVGEIKSPSKPRFSAGSPSPAFQRSTSSGSSSSNGSSVSRPTGVTSPRSSLRKSPEKDALLRRSNSGEAKSNLSRKISSPTSPIKSPSSETPPFQRSASIGSRRKIISEDADEDINVKERVAIWSAGKARDISQSKDIHSVKIDKVAKTEKTVSKKQEPKAGKESVSRKNSVPLSPTRKTSIPKVTPSSPSIPKVNHPSMPKSTPPSPGLPKATPFPSAAQKVPATSITKNSSKSSNIGEGSVDGNASGGNVAVRGNSGQQRRIRDMAAIFERDSPTSAKPGLLRQSSREEKKERY